MHEQSTNHISLKTQAWMLCKVTHCAGRVSANTRPHQLHWGDREMGTAIISCVECSQVAGNYTASYTTIKKSLLSSVSSQICLQNFEPWYSNYVIVHTLAIPLKHLSSLSVLTLKVVCRVKMLLIVCMWCMVVLNYSLNTHEYIQQIKNPLFNSLAKSLHYLLMLASQCFTFLMWLTAPMVFVAPASLWILSTMCHQDR